MPPAAGTWDTADAYRARPVHRQPKRTWLGLSGLQRRLLLQLGLVIVPPLLLFGLGRPAQAGRAFWGLYGLILAAQVLRGRRDELLCLLLALGPMINLLRAFATYNIVVVLYFCALAFYALGDSARLWRLGSKYPLLLALLVGVTGYWLVSFFNTRDYSVNLRLYELALAVCSLLLLARDQKWLGAMLLGLICTSVGLGLAMLPHYLASSGAARLGMVIIDGYILGNPVQLGVPLALSFLALSLDRGAWLDLDRPGLWRAVLLGPVAVLLALTTSRAAWGVAALGLLLSFLWGRRQRVQILLVVLVVAGSLGLLMRAPWSDAFNRGVERTFSGGGSLAHRTSGRTDQWKVAWYAFRQSPRSILLGYGPGTGAQVYIEFAPLVEGVTYGVGHRIALHSLYMQIMVEAGSLGLLTLSGALLWMLWMAFRCAQRLRVVFPLACLTGYIFVVVTVSGNDTVSGILLGIGMWALGLAESRLAGQTAPGRWQGLPPLESVPAGAPLPGPAG